MPVLTFAAAGGAKNAADEAKKTTTERRLESLLDDIPKSPPSLLLAAPGSGAGQLTDRDAESPAVASPTGARKSSREGGASDGSDAHAQRAGAAGSGHGSNHVVSDVDKIGAKGTRCARLVETSPLFWGGRDEEEVLYPGLSLSLSTSRSLVLSPSLLPSLAFSVSPFVAHHPNHTNSPRSWPQSNSEPTPVHSGRFRDRAEELGEGGGVLKLLKPLLDSFIREDTQRTGKMRHFCK